ncbi:MAG: twin-arginine translocase TatA/TatE family subunit [Desulfovibrionaceae bacterium]|nr:twin-arginine translocase TatA/TatE family subunit [Desulfovibrionaceae bacterium]
MFGIDSSGFIIIMIVALIVVGPERLPEIMAKLGKFMAQLRGMTHEVKRSFEIEFERADLEKRKAEAMKELFPEEEPARAEAEASAESELAVETAELAEPAEAPGAPDETDAETGEAAPAAVSAEPDEPAEAGAPGVAEAAPAGPATPAKTAKETT